jgi:hypothetical protein
MCSVMSWSTRRKGRRPKRLCGGRLTTSLEAVFLSFPKTGTKICFVGFYDIAYISKPLCRCTADAFVVLICLTACMSFHPCSTEADTDLVSAMAGLGENRLCVDESFLHIIHCPFCQTPCRVSYAVLSYDELGRIWMA